MKQFTIEEELLDITDRLTEQTAWWGRKAVQARSGGLNRQWQDEQNLLIPRDARGRPLSRAGSIYQIPARWSSQAKLRMSEDFLHRDTLIYIIEVSTGLATISPLELYPFASGSELSNLDVTMASEESPFRLFEGTGRGILRPWLARRVPMKRLIRKRLIFQMPPAFSDRVLAVWQRSQQTAFSPRVWEDWQQAWEQMLVRAQGKTHT